ncbi:hypothetical protein CDL15_Pgr024286 [Punica granatum]|uniref:Uncharacterized protein n=1 Tax=Punica granatum TaxID=22663 RepID=A0A218XXP4_PUNGR|nr:hypothetical protein CDL15_Pgr024286 [Punica granatum]
MKRVEPCLSGSLGRWQKRNSNNTSSSRPVVYRIGSSSNPPLARRVRVKFTLRARRRLPRAHSFHRAAGLL